MIALLLWASPQAYGLQSVTDPMLICSSAALVVVAEVTSQETVRVPDSGGDLQTTTWLHVSKSLRGDAPSTVEVRSLGGTLGLWSHHVSDQPKLEIDHRYVLLLDGNEPARVVGGDVGVFDVGFDDTALETVVAQLGGCL